MKMFKTPQHGEVGEDLLTDKNPVSEEPDKLSLNVPLIPFNGLVLYEGMDVTLSVKISISDYEYRVLARKVKPGTIKTTTGSIRYKEYIDPIPIKLSDDVEIRVVEVFYKLSFNEIFVRCDIENEEIDRAISRFELIAAGNNLIKQLKSIGFSIFKSEKYGDLFPE